MGHGKKKKTEVVEKYDWPFEISIKLDKTRPKVAFLSGAPRGYYPEDPGHSKFGLAYCIPVDDNPRCQLEPSTNRLTKPISLLGYGIGGLSGPRFAPLVNEENPAPNEYQEQLVAAPLKKSERPKRVKWHEIIKHYEEVVEQQVANYDKHLQTLARVGQRKSVDLHQSAKKSRFKVDPTQERSNCSQRFAAFGAGLTTPRFPKVEVQGKMGVGTYNTNKSTLKESFQITSPEGKLIPRVRIVCHPRRWDTCLVCETELFDEDYYQTKNKFRVLKTEDPLTDGKYKMSHLSLCRHCYCVALKEGCTPWQKTEIPSTFMKARHCNSVHDHQEGQPQYLMRTTCKALRNLQRKELIYSKYFKDEPCEKTR